MLNVNLTDAFIRDYELSVWTLQDSLITVLKPSKAINRDQIQNPDMHLRNDGTLELSFTIPMYTYQDGEKIENPNWFSVINGTILADLRKIKVIFNKPAYNDDNVFEFVITKVKETHGGEELFCDVEAESLAYHELGKTGYKISLSSDDYYEEWNTWVASNQSTPEPINNIDYWANKVLEGSNWKYKVDMDWSSYTGADENRVSNKVYEDAYVSSWSFNENTKKLTPQQIQNTTEKLRLIDESESNRYNLTQTIAEKFNVFCRYKYIYDENYHIKERWVVFYNNFIEESNGIIGINYKYNSNNIKREMDGTDIVTKMYIKPLANEESENGYTNIMDTDANKMGEDYLLDFDYLYEIGGITQDQYDEIKEYENKIGKLNLELRPLERRLEQIENELIEVEAQKTFYENAISLDKERINSNNKLLDNLTDGTGWISITENRPDNVVWIKDNTSGYSYINIRQKGVDFSSIRLYRSYNSAAAAGSRLTNPVTFEQLGVIAEYDTEGSLIKIKALTSQVNTDFSNSLSIYMIYNYSPEFYYRNIIKTWNIRLGNDQNSLDLVTIKLQQLEDTKNILETDITKKINGYNDGNITIPGLKTLRNEFEFTMGSALREGYWQPENEYSKYGEKHSEQLILRFNPPNTFSSICSIAWDDELFDNELGGSYKLGITEQDTPYYIIDLSNHIAELHNYYSDNLNQLSFIFKDINDNSADALVHTKFFQINADCYFRFMKTNNQIIPVLLITGDFDINRCYNPYIGLFNNWELENTSYVLNTTNFINVSNEIRSIDLDNEKIVYPRIQITAPNLKTSENVFNIIYNNNRLIKYEDYYLLTRGVVIDNQTNESNFNYYATIKPDVVMQAIINNGSINNLSYTCNYILSNDALFVYLDAIQVLHENAYPRVSYDVDTTVVNENFTSTAYKQLNRICSINDTELKFDNVRGYISELRLDLDHPQNDKIKIANYKTKFEDLFSKIVVQTEAMKKNSAVIDVAARIFTSTGELERDILQKSINRADLNYAFNNGTLTIDEANGIWGVSDDGVVAFRGGGIFTATQKDANDNWIWNTGILPNGINADLITTGQLDTNLVRVFAGDDLKLVLKGDGLFAYRSQWSNDNGTIAANERSDGLDLGQYVVHNGDGLFLRAEKGTSGAKIKFNFNYYNGNITIAQVKEERIDVYTAWQAGDNPLLVAYYADTNSYKRYVENGNGSHWIDLEDTNIKQFIDYVIKFFSTHFKNKNIIYWFNNAVDENVARINLTAENHQWQDYNVIINYNTKDITVYSYVNNQLYSEIINYGSLTEDVNRVAISWDGLTLRNWNNEKTLYADADTGDLNIKGKITATALEIVDNNEIQNIDDYISNKGNIEYYANYDNILPKNLNILEWKKVLDNDPAYSKYLNIWSRERYKDNNGNIAYTQPILIQESTLPCINLLADHRIYFYGKYPDSDTIGFTYEENNYTGNVSLLTLTAVPQNVRITEWRYRLGDSGIWSPIPEDWYYNNTYQGGTGRVICIDLNHWAFKHPFSNNNDPSASHWGCKRIYFMVKTNIDNVQQFISISAVDKTPDSLPNSIVMHMSDRNNSFAYVVNGQWLPNQYAIQSSYCYVYTENQLYTIGIDSGINNWNPHYLDEYFVWGAERKDQFHKFLMDENKNKNAFESRIWKDNTWVEFDGYKTTDQQAPTYHLINFKDNLSSGYAGENPPYTVRLMIDNDNIWNDNTGNSYYWDASFTDVVKVEYNDNDFKTDIELLREQLKAQSDGEIITWFGTEIPTRYNDPAKNWGTDYLKENHIGDIYYNNNSGLAYKWSHDDSNGYFWKVFSDSAVVSALDAAGEAQGAAGRAQGAAEQAQITANKKIRTFIAAKKASETAPENTEGPFTIGDIWIDSDEQIQTIYRYNGNSWVKANDARVYANTISNGTTGINFDITDNDSQTAIIEMNKSVGLKLTNHTGNYFQVTPTHMGFFDKNRNFKLGFDGNNLYVKGTIYANAGKIGSLENGPGWTIGTNSLYSGGKSTLNSTAEGIYFGIDGISILNNSSSDTIPFFSINTTTSSGQGLYLTSSYCFIESLQVNELRVKNNTQLSYNYSGENKFILDTNHNYVNLSQVAAIINNTILTQSISIFINTDLSGELVSFYNIQSISNDIGIYICGIKSDTNDRVIEHQVQFINCTVPIYIGSSYIQNNSLINTIDLPTNVAYVPILFQHTKNPLTMINNSLISLDTIHIEIKNTTENANHLKIKNSKCILRNISFYTPTNSKNTFIKANDFSEVIINNCIGGNSSNTDTFINANDTIIYIFNNRPYGSISSNQSSYIFPDSLPVSSTGSGGNNGSGGGSNYGTGGGSGIYADDPVETSTGGKTVTAGDTAAGDYYWVPISGSNLSQLTVTINNLHDDNSEYFHVYSAWGYCHHSFKVPHGGGSTTITRSDYLKDYANGGGVYVGCEQHANYDSITISYY